MSLHPPFDEDYFYGLIYGKMAYFPLNAWKMRDMHSIQKTEITRNKGCEFFLGGGVFLQRSWRKNQQLQNLSNCLHITLLLSRIGY